MTHPSEVKIMNDCNKPILAWRVVLFVVEVAALIAVLLLGYKAIW